MMSVVSNQQAAFVLAQLLRDTFRLNGEEKSGDSMTIGEDTRDALMAGLYQLAELTSEIAKNES